MIISSQRYLDDATVAQKRADRDYVVSVSPVFQLDGAECQVVLDGHHSLAAAQADGGEPEYVEADATDDDRVGLINEALSDFLTVCWADSDWYDIATGVDAF